MQQLITITQNWQFYIPEDIREEVGITKPTKAKISTKNKKIIIEPIKSKISKIAGMFAGAKPAVSMKLNRERDYIDYSQW